MSLMPKPKAGEQTPLILHQPVVIVHQLPDKKIETMIFDTGDDSVNSPAGIGLIVCDIVRHAAAAYDVDEEDIFHWLDRERDNPTTNLTGGRVQ